MEQELNRRETALHLNVSTLLVIIFWGVQMGAKGFAIDTTNSVYRIISIALVPIAMLKIIFFRYQIKNIIFSLGITLLTVCIAFTNSSTRELIIALSIITFKDIKIDEIMKMTFYVRGGAFLLRIFLCFVGKFDLEQNALGECAFGFGHSNLAHGEFFAIFSSFVLWKLNKIRFYQLVLLNLANITLFIFTQSKTPFILIFMLSFLVMFRDVNKYQKFLKFAVPKAYVSLTVLTILMSLFYYQLPYRPHNTFFSRFQTAFYMFRFYPINLFGNDVNFLNDLGYVDILFTSGIPWFLFFVIGHTALGGYFAKRSNWVILSYLLIISVYFTMEAYAESVLYNYCWLYYTVLLFHKDSLVEKLCPWLIKEML